MSRSGGGHLRGDIAIVGMGGQFPGAPTLGAFWDNIRTGRVAAGPVPRDRWNHDIFYSPTGAREHNRTYAQKLATIANIRDFAPEFFGLTPRRAKVMDPQQRLFLDAVRVALEDAGYGSRPFPRERTGVFVGATVSDFMDILTARVRSSQVLGGEWGAAVGLSADAQAQVMESLAPMQAYSLVGSLMNMVAANVNQAFDLGGPAFTTDAACSSALVALNEAVLHLRAGLCDAAVVGGAYMILTPDNMIAFARIGALSPTDSCRPYDGRADGFFIGEGVGAVLLRRLEDAQAAGDRIYAVIKGIAANSDGKAEGPMTPRREGQLDALVHAYDDAGIAPRTVGFLEGHGTATPVGDATEVAAFRDCLGASDVGTCAVSSVKGNIGHTMSAAGIAGLIKATLCLVHRTRPPQAGYGVPRPELELDRAGLYVPTVAQDWPNPGTHPRRAGVNGFGFGGTNVHVVLEEAPASGGRRVTVAVPAGMTASAAPAMPQLDPGRDAEPGPELILLSAPTPARLREAAAALASSLLDLPDGTTLPDVALGLARRRTDDARLAIVAQDLDDLATKLRAAAAGTNGDPLPAGVMRADAAVAPEDRRLAFLFPGQGLQSPGLCGDLYRRFPAFRAELDSLAAAASDLPRPLLSYLYPDHDGAEARAALTATEVCQPAVAAVSLALARFVGAMGVLPHVVAGHSLGEFTAAAAVGVLDELACVRLVGQRGQLIATLLGDGPRRGTMTAVSANEATVAKLIAGLDDVAIANLNHPRQVVIAGGVDAVAIAEARFAAAGLRSTRLNVSHAFHSARMAPIAAELAPLLAALSIAPPRALLISAIRPGRFPTDEAVIRRLLAEHATARVDFAGAVAACAQHGARVFVQIGAGSALSTMATATLDAAGAAPIAALTLATATPDHGRTFLETLGRLFVLGLPLDLEGLFLGREAQAAATLPPSLLDTRPLWPVAQRESETTTIAMAPLDAGAGAVEASPVKRDPSQPAAAVPGETGDLRTLFDRQMAVLEANMAVIRQQNELLLRGGTAVMRATKDEPSGSNGHTNGHGHGETGAGHGNSNGHSRGIVSEAELTDKVIDIVARITAHPHARLRPTTRLGADLGFDSLMVAELVAGLQELVPTAPALPRTLFAEDLSINEVARHLARSLTADAETTAPASPAARVDIKRYVVTYEPMLTSSTRRLTTALAGAVRILPDRHGVAEALRARLGRDGVSADIAADVAGLARGAHVIDLRGLSAQVAADAGSLRGSAVAAFELGRDLDDARPATLLFAHAGLAASGVAGLAKALGREWPESRVLAVEFGTPGQQFAPPDAATLADQLASELSGTATASEVRYAGDARLAPVLRLAELPYRAAGLPSNPTVVISGGGGGLGAKLALALAQRHSARLVLLGRRTADAAMEGLCAEIRAAGGDALYLSCDVRDGAAVASAIDQGRRRFGPIHAAVHTAGITDDGAVGRKQSDGFARVFDTKVAGALALWQALLPDPLSAFLVYGSWAGRFGNAHQTDYAAANHVVARLCEVWANQRTSVRVATLDLPPWDGSTMLSRVPEMVRAEMQARGVPTLTDAVGIDHVLAELSATGIGSGEVLLAGLLPLRPTQVLVRTRMSVTAQPWLEDHRINGRVVLPLAAAADLMIEAARAALAQSLYAAPHAALHAAPNTGAVAAGIEVTNLTVVKGVVLPDDAADVAARASVEASAAQPAPVAVELLTVGERAGLAYRAHVGHAAAEPALVVPSNGGGANLSLAEFYARHTFHGPRLQALESIGGVGAGHASGTVFTGPVGSDDHLAFVRALDGALQLAAYWAITNHGRLGLPVSVGRLHVAAPIAPGRRLLARGVLRRGEGGRFEGDLDLVDETGAALVQMRGFVGELLDAPLTAGEPSIDPATFRPEEFPEVKELRGRLAFAHAAGIEVPYFRTLDGLTGATARIDGRDLINFTSYNYVGLSGHPRITEAVTEAVKRYGTSVSASRVTGGQKPLHADLEQEISRFLGCEATLVMVGGHATNVAVIGHLLGAEDLVVHDSLAHDSILGGARLAGARRRPFAHNDPGALDKILREVRSSVRRVLIAVEGVYSMDGDITPLPEIIALKKKYGALLLVDEAHSLGVLGRTGRGVGEHFNVDRRDVDIWMGTMSKTLASCGGYVSGSAALIEYLKFTTPGFIYSVGITPANAAAALTALRLLEAEPERTRACQDRARTFLRLCRDAGVNTGDSHDSAVVPCIVGNSYASLKLAESLLGRGIHVQPILYPAVPEEMARLRFFVTAAHTEDQLRFTARVLAEELGKLGLLPEGKRPAPELTGGEATA